MDGLYIYMTNRRIDDLEYLPTWYVLTEGVEMISNDSNPPAVLVRWAAAGLDVRSEKQERSLHVPY